MLSVRVPPDIDEVKIGSVGGLTPKVAAYFGTAAAITILLSLFGSAFMPTMVVRLVIILVCSLIMLPVILEKGGRAGISGEEALINIITFMKNPQKRAYEFYDDIAAYDIAVERRKAAMAKKKKKKRKFEVC